LSERAATTPNNGAAIATAKMIRILMNPRVREHGSQRWRKKTREI
jgi:hypothetical protein